MSRVRTLQPGETQPLRLALVTGANAGIGVAKKGYSLIIHGRRQDAVNAAVLEVRSHQIRPSASVSGLSVDLSDLSAANEAAIKLKDTLPRLDLLTLNAALMGIHLASIH